MTMDIIYSRKADFVQREVAGEFILIPVRRRLSEANSLYVLNETGAAVWKRLDGKRSLREIIGEIIREFDVTADQLEKDLASLVEDLLSIQAIEEAPS
jgi:hypothetical protein